MIRKNLSFRALTAQEHERMRYIIACGPVFKKEIDTGLIACGLVVDWDEGG
jgi:hypothetical protein